MGTMEPTAVVHGVVVGLDYVLTVDGEIIDSTTKREPLEYLHGANNIISGLELALQGMSVGESKQVEIEPAEAYGEIDPQKFTEIERVQFPADFALEVGNSLYVRDNAGAVSRAYIDQVGEDSVRLNLNHPLAGKHLSFWAQVATLRPATAEEMASGRVGGGCAGCNSADCGTDGCCS